MEDMNVIIVTGNLGADPTTATYKGRDNSDQLRAEFRIACNRRKRGDTEETDWFTIKTFGGLATTVANNLSKGRRVLVQGRMQIDVVDSTKHPGEKSYFQSIIADRVQFLDAPPSAGGQQQQQGSAAAQPGSDLPF